MIMNDWNWNSVSTVTVNWFANNRNYERDKNDYYATEPKAVNLLLELEQFNNNIWECSCWEWHLSKAMISKWYNVYSTDLIDRWFGSVQDFLLSDKEWDWDIITNPPYKYASDFILKWLSLTKEWAKVAMFLPIRYTEWKARKKLFQQHPPRVIYVSSWRLKCAMNWDFDSIKGSAVSYAWFIWEKGYKWVTELKWFN